MSVNETYYYRTEYFGSNITLLPYMHENNNTVLHLNSGNGETILHCCHKY